MSRYEYILLDWDGNLAKTMDVWLEAVRATLLKRGIELSDMEIAAGFGAVHEYFTGWGVQDMQAAIDDMDTYAKTRLPNAELYPDAVEVLEGLRNGGKKIALITTSLKATALPLLEAHNLSHYFDVIITHYDTKHHKPHAEPLEKALTLLGGTKDKAVMIGDSDKDMGAALNAGVDSILFYPPEHKRFYSLEKLKEFKPTYVVEDFRQVLSIV